MLLLLVAGIVSVEGCIAEQRAEAGKKGVEFFGITDQGESVVYLISTQAHMPFAFEALKVELARSVKALRPEQKLAIIVYAQGGLFLPFVGTEGGFAQVGEGDGLKKTITSWLYGLHAQSLRGSLDPRAGIRLACNLRGGPPEVIFLVLSAWTPPPALQYIKEQGRRSKTRINVIALELALDEGLLREAASATGGIYRLVKEERLKEIEKHCSEVFEEGWY